MPFSCRWGSLESCAPKCLGCRHLGGRPCQSHRGIEEIKSHRACRCSILRRHLPPQADSHGAPERAGLTMPRFPQECRTQNLYHSLLIEEEPIWARQRRAMSLWVLGDPGQGWWQHCWGGQAPPGQPLLCAMSRVRMQRRLAASAQQKALFPPFGG